MITEKLKENEEVSPYSQSFLQRLILINTKSLSFQKKLRNH